MFFKTMSIDDKILWIGLLLLVSWISFHYNFNLLFVFQRVNCVLSCMTARVRVDYKHTKKFFLNVQLSTEISGHINRNKYAL